MSYRYALKEAEKELGPSDIASFTKMTILDELKQLNNNEQMEVATMPIYGKNTHIKHKKLEKVIKQVEVEYIASEWNIIRNIDTKTQNNIKTAQAMSEDLGHICLTWDKKKADDQKLSAEYVANTGSDCKEINSALLDCPADELAKPKGTCNEPNFSHLAAWKEAQKQDVGKTFTAATVPIKFNKDCTTTCEIDFKKVGGATESVEWSPNPGVCTSSATSCTITYKYLEATTSSWSKPEDMMNFLKDYVIVKKTAQLSTKQLASWEIKKKVSSGDLERQFCQKKEVFEDHDSVEACAEVNGFKPLIWEKVLVNQDTTQVTPIAKVHVKLGTTNPIEFDVTIKLQKGSDNVSYTSDDTTLTISYDETWQANDRSSTVPNKISKLLEGVCAGFSNDTDKENTFNFAKCKRMLT